MPAGAKLFLSMGCLLALAAVAIGAFGAHGLKARLSPEMLGIYQTGVQYHFYHAPRDGSWPPGCCSFRAASTRWR